MFPEFKKFFILCALLVGLFSFFPAAKAEENQYRNWNTSGYRQTASFTQNDKNIVIQYYQRYCTAKRTKKTQDCIPATTPKKYTLGKPLANNTKVRALPNDLLAKLSTLPRGYEYLKIDRDVLIVSTRTGKVVDVVVMGKAASSTASLSIINSYVVYFNPQTAALRWGESRILNQIAREMTQYKPTQVTITSYADSVVGTSSQNPLTDERVEMIFDTLNAFGMNIQNPSQITSDNTKVAKSLSTIARRQAETVAQELSNRNIPSKIVTSNVRGTLERDLRPEDNTEEDVTQMVVIDFRK